MRQLRAALCALAAISTTWTAATAQVGADDGWVLPPGIARFGVGAGYSHFGERMGTSWADLFGPLDASAFPPLVGTRARMDAFLAATGGEPIEASALMLGEPDLALRADVREVPMSLSIGVLPRIEVGLTLPIHRSELHVGRFGFPDANIGTNPDPEGNAAAFAAVDPEFEELGRATFLPIQGTPLAVQLQRRVAEGGLSLTLPTGPPDGEIFNLVLVSELGVPPVERRLSPWAIGDAEAHARVLIASSMGVAPFPSDSAPVHYRASGVVGVRLPTGAEPDTLRLFSAAPHVGLTGWSAGLSGDLFVGRHAWLTATAAYSSTRPVDVTRRVTPPGLPFGSTAPLAVRWTPPSELRLTASPRVRLEDAIAIGVDYALLRVGPSAFAADGIDASVLDAPGGEIQRLGVSVRFSSLASYTAGADVVPFEASIGYSRTVAGPDGTPESRALRMEGRLLHRFWGR